MTTELTILLVPSTFSDSLTTWTVLDLSLAYVQWSQAVTLLPVVKASEFVANESLLAFAMDAGGNTALTDTSENAADAFADLLNRNRRSPFFFPAGLR